MTLPKCGLPLSFALPAKSFKGIAAQAVEHEDGSKIVSLELHHSDPELCIPLLIADNLDDIAADWHSWSRLMKLPMLVIGEDGLSQPVRDELGMVMVESPIARRKRITAYKPRPWFLKRRKTGVIGEVTKDYRCRNHRAELNSLTPDALAKGGIGCAARSTSSGGLFAR